VRFPAAAKTKSVVVKPVLPLEKMSLCEIDAAVAGRIGSGQDLYQVDERLLERLAPTHILAQLLQQPGWSDLPAALNVRAFAVNANAYFARPGPRVVDGVE
jgi:hypothetical protein